MQSLLEILPQIGKYTLIVVSGIMADRGLKRLQAFRKRTQTASETVIDVDKMIVTYTNNMAKSSKELEDERAKRIGIKKKYDELEEMYYKKSHECGRFATYVHGTIQLLNAHNKVCDCDNSDLVEYAILLERGPRSAEYIHGFENIAKRHGLYKANGGDQGEPEGQGTIKEPRIKYMKFIQKWERWAGNSLWRIGISLLGVITLILLLAGLISYLLR